MHRNTDAVPGVYYGTCVETAFLLSYPLAKEQHPYAEITIQIGLDHAILRAGDVIYDPISDTLGVKMDYWTDAEVVEERLLRVVDVMETDADAGLDTYLGIGRD